MHCKGKINQDPFFSLCSLRFSSFLSVLLYGIVWIEFTFMFFSKGYLCLLLLFFDTLQLFFK